MKCIVTGHTSGIGKAIFEHFQSKGYEVIGLSRSNGYDISTEQDRILELANGCDIFVNNAYHDTCQLALLEKLKTSVKNMIVVGSVAADWANIWKGYGLNKFELQERCKELALEDNPSICNVFYLKLAFCENAQWPIFVDSKYKATFADILEIIDMWIKIPKIFSVEFTLKKTKEIMDYARRNNPHD